MDSAADEHAERTSISDSSTVAGTATPTLESWRSAAPSEISEDGPDHLTPLGSEGIPDIPVVVEDDSWILNWDMAVRTCAKCKRVFTTDERLRDHEATWHASEAADALQKTMPALTIPEKKLEDVIHGDPDGDVLLVLEGDPNEPSYHIRIDSGILTRGSSVFREMLKGSGSSTETAAVRRAKIAGLPLRRIPLYTDDQACGFWLVFMLLYHEYDRIAEYLDSCLYELAKIVHEYRFDILLKHPLVMPYNKKPFEGSASERLFTAWVFRFPDVFQETSRIISLETGWNSAKSQLGRSRSDGSWAPICPDIPAKIITRLKDLRDRRLSGMREYITKTHNELLLSKSKDSTRCGEPFNAPHCDLMQLGSLMRAASEHKLLSDSTWDRYTVQKHAAILSSIPEEGTNKIIGGAGIIRHIQCSWLDELEQLAHKSVEVNWHLGLPDFPWPDEF